MLEELKLNQAGKMSRRQVLFLARWLLYTWRSLIILTKEQIGRGERENSQKTHAMSRQALNKVSAMGRQAGEIKSKIAPYQQNRDNR